jgi:hypothetical protein
MGYVLGIINLLKRNNENIKPFSKHVQKYSKGKPLFSKKLSYSERKEILLKLKENRPQERENRTYKMIISLGLTIISLSMITYFIRSIFF